MAIGEWSGRADLAQPNVAAQLPSQSLFRRIRCAAAISFGVLRGSAGEGSAGRIVLSAGREEWSGRADLNCRPLPFGCAQGFVAPLLRQYPCSGSQRNRGATNSSGNRRMVGTGRFELPTPRTPSECSTRLSHVPTGRNPLLVRGGWGLRQNSTPPESGSAPLLGILTASSPGQRIVK